MGYHGVVLDTRFPVSLHIMTSLAHAEGQLMNSEYLAQSIQTNPTVVRRLVSKLVSAGLIRSFKGKSGGIKLAKSPKQIFLSDIYSATDHGAPFSAPNKKPLKACQVSCSMGKIFKNLFSDIEKAQLDYMGNISLDDIAKQIHEN
jgi:Rrf2 family protein